MNPVLRFASALAVTIVIFGAMPAIAQNQFDLSALKEGEILVNLDATSQREVEQDMLVAHVQYTAQGTDKTALQNEVNQAISRAVQKIEQANADDMSFSTTRYHVYIHDQRRNRDGTPAGGDVTWRAQQGIEMRGENSAAILEIVGQLQADGLHVTGLNFTLSSRRFANVTDVLISDALDKLTARANRIAADLGKSSAALVEVNVSTNQHYQPRMMRAEMSMASSDAAMAPPAAVPGQTDVSLTVSARALLKP